MTIALLTDFGTRDYFVGAMKGVILSINGEADIVDITHEIEPQNIREAEFTLRACYQNFPRRTIFAAVVDPGVGSSRRAIVCQKEDYYFIAPDNGLLGFIFNGQENFEVYEITNDVFFNRPVSKTFHGRDIFAPCAAHLSKGILPAEFGNKISDFQKSGAAAPRRLDDRTIEAGIIHADRFGNLITNLETAEMPQKFEIQINEQRIKKLLDYFAEAEKNELFMIGGSAGFLEIAAFQNSAKELLNARIGDKIKVIIED